MGENAEGTYGEMIDCGSTLRDIGTTLGDNRSTLGKGGLAVGPHACYVFVHLEKEHKASIAVACQGGPQLAKASLCLAWVDCLPTADGHGQLCHSN